MLRIRPLSKDEKKALYKIQHRAKCGISRLRATVVLAASRRVPCSTIAQQRRLNMSVVWFMAFWRQGWHP